MREPQTRGLFGARAAVEMDNPKAVSRSVSERLAFVRRVYGWMFAGILATIAGVAISVQSGIAESMLGMGLVGHILLVVAWMGAAYLVQKVRHKEGINVIAFGLYGAFTGFVISNIVFVAMILATQNGSAAGTYVMQAGVLTLVAFGSLSAYAFFTRRDFSFLRGMLVVGTVVLLVALVAGFFIEATALHLIISVFGVLLFAGYTLYDTQKVLRTYPDGEHVAGAMTLFLDFVLLFVYILRLILILASGDR